MAKQRLGRGFDALMPKDIDKSIIDEDKNRVQKLLIQDIVPNPDQPRKSFGKAELRELSESIKRHGVLQPLIVVRHSNKYKIVAGERRWRAAQEAKLSHIPAVVRSLEELEQVELALIENVQRVDLSPLEQALSVYKLQHQFNLTLEEIAKRLGKAQTTVSNLLRLLQLPEGARESLRDGRISEGHARAILALKAQPDKQRELLRSILDNKWSVRQAEQFVIKVKKARNNDNSSNDEEIIELLSTKVGAKVQVKRKSKGGQIIIPFNSENQLNKILKNF